MADFYDILGVSRNASDAEIKKAYRKAAVKWHPDKWSGKSESERKNAEEMFKKVAEANEVLSDPDKRAKYDQFGDDWDKVNNGSGGFNFDFDLGGMFKHFHNPFGDIFGNRSENRGPEPGATIQAQIAVDINDIYNGGTRELEVKVNVRCKHCHGEGGSGVKTCPYCHGTGMVTESRQFGPGQFMQTSHPCEHCGGTGKTMSNVCSHCHGTGFDQETKHIKINIHPGIQNGEDIVFRGMGYESKDPKGKNGDLIVKCVYKIDPDRYAIQGNDVYEKITLPYYDCIVGGKKEMTLPNGKKHTITINPCSHEGARITCSGKGINGGSYIYIISVSMPTYINDKERKLLEEIQKLHK